ncbi:ATP-dependent RecD-like DNA helicase [Phragmitibacter flavus]|uniref:ATP-dependent RecD-like DNA helicase n=1 Tax=Phragmitibacter flavus TaxID=2576071 RepID=A0A5R8KIK4_9BACT|nr:ATP-dependent RecD-like DNA helicase [Phragmitibacter flavus]TLD72144.1 ATP-dependent RecD-like DNA helicase [Phragmitibacter flavus]
MTSRPRPTPQSHATLSGVVERVTHHNEEDGYAILKIQPPGRSDLITVTGNVPRVVPGEKIEARGEWINNPEYGRQFKAATIHLSQPDTLQGLERYLGSGLIDGIGPKYAKRIVKKFGTTIFDIIENESARLEEVEGVGKKRRQEIRASWMKQKTMHDIMVFLHQRGISTSRAQRIHRTYGDQSLEILQTNPYQLADDIHGVGFKTADDIAAHMGIEKAAPQRLRAGLLHALETATTHGHNCLPRDLLISDAEKLLAVPPAELQPQLDQLLADDTLISDPVEKRDLIYLPTALQGEISIAKHLQNLLRSPSSYPPIDIDAALQWCAQTTKIQLAPSQQDAVRAALTQRVLIITGGPGVGKTTIINSILAILTAKNIKPILAAPTGRAAQRLAASTGHDASTMHRLLEFQGNGVWGHHHGRPLKGDLFVLDEASMIDTPLMAQYLSAIPTGAHLLIVGDADQLPSVGPGSVLQDLIASQKIPTVHLSEIFRQAAKSRIVTAAHAINQGKLPDLKPSPDSDFFFLEKSDPLTLQQTVLNLCHHRLPTKYPFDPIRDIQVLTPMNVNELGTRRFNQLLQNALNPPHEMKFEIERGNQLFRVGDKVIQTRNNYEKETFNGDIGHILRIDLDPITIHVRFEGNRDVTYEPIDLDQLQLAYAITIHKSQGSEFPCIIIPWSMSQFIMLERSLIYTALTRGRKLVIIVGEEKALNMAIQKTNSRKRWTGLRSRLTLP